MDQDQTPDVGTGLRGWDVRTLLFLAALVGGAFLRFYALGRVPAGLNSDEAAAGVEALSVLQTGADLWGNHLPVYFPAWGSGMNVLYSYLSIPVIASFGLNALTIRVVNAFFGLLTIPITYAAARVHFGRDTALLSTTLVAFLPWNVMGSRWALESNLLPFWFTLGLYTLGNALDERKRPVWRVLAFIPWAIGVYAYAASVIPIAVSGLVILCAFRRHISANAGSWLLGIALAVLIDIPFLLFLLKNQLGIQLTFEPHLPFSLPHLEASRLRQIQKPFLVTISKNLAFFLGGYRDGNVW